ncbi:MAG: AzlC family ABC transporter permease [Brevibacillus sp.]|nr:AzlC family ABC transporter permease [Brevibacillus sp.]
MLDALPITVSLVLFGAIFGMLSLQTGLSPWQSVAMSMIVFAGSAQFTALSMLADNAGVWAIILATFLLNSRHFLMGLSMSPYYQRFSTAQINGLAFFLIDEQYAITLNRFRHHQSDLAYLWSVSLLLYGGWVVGTLIGTLAGRWIPDPAALGLGFSFTAMFVALAYYQLTSLIRIASFLLCGTVAVGLALVLPDGLHLLAAGVVAFLIGYLLPQADEQTAGPAQQKTEVETA